MKSNKNRKNNKLDYIINHDDYFSVQEKDSGVVSVFNNSKNAFDYHRWLDSKNISSDIFNQPSNEPFLKEE